ncbi:hypothetical protein LguiA_029559 [Lonicera macranthoides]
MGGNKRPIFESHRSYQLYNSHEFRVCALERGEGILGDTAAHTRYKIVQQKEHGMRCPYEYEPPRYKQHQHSSHALSIVNAYKNKQQLVPILGTKPSVFALVPTTIARNNQKPQLQPATIATDTLDDQNGVVTGVKNKDFMPSNTFMALNEVFGAHSPSSYHIQSPSHKLDSLYNDVPILSKNFDSIANTSRSSKHAKANHHNTSSFEKSFVLCSVSLKKQNLKTHAKDGDGDGENWDFFEESDDDITATIAHDDDQFHAVTPSNGNIKEDLIECSKLSVKESLNWGNMAEEEPFQSREALADAQFKAAIAKHSNNDGCIQLLEDDRSAILHQNFPPLGTTCSSSSIQKAHLTIPTSPPLLDPQRLILFYKPELKDLKKAQKSLIYTGKGICHKQQLERLRLHLGSQK